jgi:aprataxin
MLLVNEYRRFARHLHLHVLSNDLCSEKMKIKKHYNSYHPTLGFFLHLHEVLSWFDEEPSYFQKVCTGRCRISLGCPATCSLTPSFPVTQMSQLKKHDYEPILKENLFCWKCERDMKNMPVLKAHLQQEWDEEARKEKAKLKRKRQRDDPSPDQRDSTTDSDIKEPARKKPSPGAA